MDTLLKDTCLGDVEDESLWVNMVRGKPCQPEGANGQE